ncbi:hypothetical protein EXN65_05740 [Clostridium botulinum]|uniref:hypothetical protein n=1 Tax=Clostridium botulinum TaxID=1491 RepID=UPI00016BB040|nr:hypothetical protein [Clostridium botulinum]EDT84487.1 anaerobic ribonucleoside-triphosphate reductase activating protein [Clostridium botulinum Bf]MBY6881715.1 hypothetical protein [Clostridium botulinum]NEZ88079.1 hypothetical protein [Clostridium botulinum]NFB01186.1 hypothetical protein [Clostridium botulinum]NFE30003.1 hypothetical protein [Clostridium botulinum]
MEKEIKELLLYFLDIGLAIAFAVGATQVINTIGTIDAMIFGIPTLISFTLLGIRMTMQVLKLQKEFHSKNTSQD